MNKRRKQLVIILVAIILLIVSVGGFFAFTAYQTSRIPDMTFEDMLAFTTGNNSRAVLAVGVIRDVEMTCTVYGENSSILPNDEHVFEIGSLTKTFTASLLFKAIDEGRISLDDSIDRYLSLPAKEYYPTIRRLVTHTSGYRGSYFENQMIGNFFKGRNDFYGISKSQLIERVGKINLKNRDYGFQYSNFGIAVVGAVLSEIYEKEFTELINEFIKTELNLGNTRISDGSGDLGNYWDWARQDAYMAAGALTSTIGDMMQYALLQMGEGTGNLAATHKNLAQVNATSRSYAKMNIRMDAVGATWILDTQNGVIWHNGGTGDYNSYLGFDPLRKIAVVILSNLPPNERIPATVMGIRLLLDMQESSVWGGQFVLIQKQHGKRKVARKLVDEILPHATWKKLQAAEDYLVQNYSGKTLCTAISLKAEWRLFDRLPRCK